MTSSETAQAAGWPDERVVGPFVFHADFSLRPYGGLLAEMAQLQQQLIDRLEIEPTRERIHLYLFARQSTYKKYVKKYFPQAPQRRALYIKRRGPGVVLAYQNRELPVDLRHESTHAVLHASLPLVPLWLDEGLAEYFEVAPALRPAGNPHLAMVRRSVLQGGVGDIRRLEALSDITDMGKRQYREAWSWVHFMLHGPPQARDELLRYLGDIRARTPPGRLSERLRRRLPDLERRYREHFLRWTAPPADPRTASPRTGAGFQ